MRKLKEFNIVARTCALRPTSTDDKEIVGISEDGELFTIRVSLSQVAYVGEQCNSIVYHKLSRDKS